MIPVREALYAVVDTESTGLVKPQVAQFGAYAGAREFEEFVAIDGKMPPEASAVHHIVDADLRGARTLDEVVGKFVETFPFDVLVAHNAEYDRALLPMLADERWLCTRRLAQHLLPDAPNFKNATLWYYLGGTKITDRLHGALPDCKLTYAVLPMLLDMYLDAGGQDDVNALIDFANRPYRLKTILFGKHRGTPFADLPLDYLQWMLRGMPDMDADLRFTVESELADRGLRRAS